MNEETSQLRQKSKRSLTAANQLHEKGNFDFAVSRAYYALFYTVESLLLIKGAAFSKHSAVITAFFHFYIKTGLLEKKYHQLLKRAFDLRNDADYVSENIISSPVSRELLSESDEFISATEKFFDT